MDPRTRCAGWLLVVSTLVAAGGGCDAIEHAVAAQRADDASRAERAEKAAPERQQPGDAPHATATAAAEAKGAPPSEPPSAPPSVERAPTAAMDGELPKGETFATLDDACKLLGSDDEAVYLTPGILGSKTILKVSMAGEVERVPLDERMQALTVEGGFVYGCAGKLRGDSCLLSRAKTSGGAIERLVKRGKVFRVTVDGDRVWTLETTGPNGAMTAFAGSITGGASETLSLEEPMAIVASRGAVVALTGHMRKNGKVQVAQGGGSQGDEWRTLVSGELTRFPHLDGGWVYYEDGNFRLARVPLEGGAPQVLRDRVAELGRPQTFGMTGNTRYVMWLEADLGDGQGQPRGILKRIEKPR